MDPVCATSGGATSGVPDSCQSMSKTYWAEPLSSSVANAVGVRSAVTLPETSSAPDLFTYSVMR